MRKLLPPTYFFLAIVLAVLLHFLLPGRRLVGYPWRLLGLLPVLMGIALNLLADRAFKRGNTTVKPFERSSVLVTGGVFGISRNPMYLSMTLILLGLVVLLGSATPFAVVPFFAVQLDRAFIAPEQRMLEEVFADRFSEYRRRVRRWI